MTCFQRGRVCLDHGIVCVYYISRALRKGDLFEYQLLMHILIKKEVANNARHRWFRYKTLQKIRPIS